MVAEIWASVISSFVDQLVDLYPQQFYAKCTDLLHGSVISESRLNV